MSPTLALLVQREADIQAFTSQPFYVPEITCGGFTASGEKLTEKHEAERIRAACHGQSASVLSVDRQTKTAQPPRLYDLTTLQRECNRIYGYTAQQTLDYLQSLYEKKLVTYPRTDSQYLTEDMQATAASLTLWLRENMPFGNVCSGEPDIGRVTDGSKVTDHHAIIPTVEIARTNLSALPAGERDVLTLIAVRLLCATSQPHRFEAVTAVVDCQGNFFTAKGKTVLQTGWKEVERLFRAGLKQSKSEEKDSEDAELPELKKSQTFEIVSASVREKGLAITMDMEPVMVYADPVQIQRITTNILENSLKYKDKEQGNVQITLGRTETGFRLSFADDGPGVSPEALPHLFEVFYRSDPSRQNPDKGNGLGLAIVANAVQRMGGTATALFGPSGGLEIRMDFPKEVEKHGKDTDC